MGSSHWHGWHFPSCAFPLEWTLFLWANSLWLYLTWTFTSLITFTFMGSLPPSCAPDHGKYVDYTQTQMISKLNLVIAVSFSPIFIILCSRLCQAAGSLVCTLAPHLRPSLANQCEHPGGLPPSPGCIDLMQMTDVGLLPPEASLWTIPHVSQYTNWGFFDLNMYSFLFPAHFFLYSCPLFFFLNVTVVVGMATCKYCRSIRGCHHASLSIYILL